MLHTGWCEWFLALTVEDRQRTRDSRRATGVNDDGMMHQQLLAKLGMPLGELWRLGPLSRHMRSTGNWDAFISIKPLNIIGGTGSPANATALV